MKAQSPPPRNGGSTEVRDGVAYAELLKMAHEEGLKSISTELLLQPSEDNGRLCIVKATVETERGHYEGLGDADPGNVEDFLAPHLIRVAETRAKARALRDAVNVGITSLEELDGVRPDGVSRPVRNAPAATRQRGNGSYPPRTNGNGSPEPMTEGQRRYLFRLMSGQGFHKDAAENRIKEIFEVGSLSEITKTAAMKTIDELLKTSAPGNGGGNGPASRSVR